MEIPPVIKKFLIDMKFYDSYLYGGCIRDYLMNKEIKDYDITTNITRSKMIKKLRKNKIEFKAPKNCTFIYLKISSYELQLGEYETVKTDFTINSFRAYLHDNFEIIGHKKAFKDLENKKLRAIDKTRRIIHRGIYMLIKYPEFNITRRTEKLFKKLKPDRERLESFIRKKDINRSEFYKIYEKIRT